jgi:hypothetical protein
MPVRPLSADDGGRINPEVVADIRDEYRVFEAALAA